MSCPATDRLNSLRYSSEMKLGKGRGFSINENDIDDNDDRMEKVKEPLSLSNKLDILSARDEKSIVKAGNVDEDDIEKSYFPLRNHPKSKDNFEKIWKSWQVESKDKSQLDDQSILIDYGPLLCSYPRNNLAAISYSTLDNVPECESDYEDVYYEIPESLDLYYYGYTPVYEDVRLKDGRNNYALTKYQDKTVKHLPSNTARTIQRAKEKSIEYFSIDEEKDPISALYIWCSRNKAIPVFTFTSEMEARGKSVLCITFICKITLYNSLSVGRGTNKKEAKKEAAGKMLRIINSGFKDDGVDRSHRNFGRLEISDRPYCRDTTIIKAQDNEVKLANNPISYLQEICLKQKWSVPVYDAVTFGSIFKCSVTLFIRSEVLTQTGFGHSKKEAKINAARKLITDCQNKGFISQFH